eukprot:642543-Hanusia_phi.AAC.1
MLNSLLQTASSALKNIRTVGSSALYTDFLMLHTFQALTGSQSARSSEELPQALNISRRHLTLIVGETMDVLKPASPGSQSFAISPPATPVAPSTPEAHHELKESETKEIFARIDVYGSGESSPPTVRKQQESVTAMLESDHHLMKLPSVNLTPCLSSECAPSVKEVAIILDVNPITSGCY